LFTYGVNSVSNRESWLNKFSMGSILARDMFDTFQIAESSLALHPGAIVGNPCAAIAGGNPAQAAEPGRCANVMTADGVCGSRLAIST
jgi:hypothetical protein